MEKTTQNESEKKSFISELFGLAKTNIRDYMMYIALVIIMIFFNWKTQGAFLQAANIILFLNKTLQINARICYSISG